MIITGIILGPNLGNIIDNSILNMSSDLRKIALIIILIRAGLSLDLNDLKKVGRPAVLMCFVPACFEILGMVILAPKLLNISIMDAAVMGTVVGAVSPAVIVPKMLKLMDKGYGVEKSIPQLILAGASVDDVFVIVMFSAFTELAQGNSVSLQSFISIPISISLGIFAGVLMGNILGKYFQKVHIRDTAKVIILLCISFSLVVFEDSFSNSIPFSALVSIMSIGIALQRKRRIVAKRLSSKFNKLWVPSEILLFVSVGATVDLKYALSAGFIAVILILGVLAFRMMGVFICLLKTKLNKRERLFCMIGILFVNEINGDYMKDKKIINGILLLALPIIIEYIFQTLLGTADTYFAGKLHDNAIAAIGVTNLITNIFIAFYTAISIGTSTVISRYVGKNDERNIILAIRQSLLLGIVLGTSIGIISLIFCKPILRIAGARDEIMSYAIPYYVIVAVPSVFLCISQIFFSCLRSMKDTKTPMIVTGFSNIINILLNFILIKAGYGIFGLAFATTVSRILVVILLFVRIKKKKNEIKIISNEIYMEKEIILNIIRIGVPARLFTDTKEVQETVIIIVRFIAFFQPFAALTRIMTSALQGSGDTKFPMYLTIIGIWVIRVGIGYLLAVPIQLGLFGVWIGYSIDITIRGILLLIRFLSGKWKKIVF